MSELRKECYKCLNNQECIFGADYGSIYCMTRRKFKMQEPIDKKEKRIKKLEKENRKLKVIRSEYAYGYENTHFITKNDLVQIDKNKYLIEIEEGKFVDLKQVYLINKNSIPKQKIKERLKKTQKLYEENLKQVDLKQVEKIDMKIFKGIKLEAERDLLRKLLQESEDK